MSSEKEAKIAELKEKLKKAQQKFNDAKAKKGQEKNPSYSSKRNWQGFSNFINKLVIKNNYIENVLQNSTNFVQRFITFVAMTQAIYFVFFIYFFITEKLFWNIDSFALNLAGTILMIGCLVLFGANIILIISFLFLGVKAKTLTFFSTSIIYLASCFFIGSWFLKVGIFSTSFNFLGLWFLWNIITSVIILLIGVARIFFLGLLFDYMPAK